LFYSKDATAQVAFKIYSINDIPRPMNGGNRRQRKNCKGEGRKVQIVLLLILLLVAATGSLIEYRQSAGKKGIQKTDQDQ
jgi:hypothetical protein